MSIEYISTEEAFNKIEKAKQVYERHRAQFHNRPIKAIRKAAEILLANKKEFAKTLSSEMGKPVSEAIAEIEKCALNCNYYADNCNDFLKDREYSTENYDAIVRYEPMGVILGIMPWNFPFWQVFRFAVPTILAGNTVLIKHADNVPQCARLLEEIFIKSGFEVGVYQNLPLEEKNVVHVIEHPAVKAVSLTGSEKAGSIVAAQAAKVIKKSVLELGGSNAFIVLDDADLDSTIEKAVNARYRNAGQSCIAAKRFLVQEGIYNAFLEGFSAKVQELKMGDPLDPETDIGPLARVDLAIKLETQVNQSVNMGAKVYIGGHRGDRFFEPTILTDVTPEMPVFKEETFGPVAAVIKFRNFDEAIKLSNQTDFGLGVSICTKNVKEYAQFSHLFEEGAVFFNQLVRSDPKLPFGGVKHSGFGRELSEEGIKEFVNIKTIFFSKI
ncbi:MAG: NAD-dependent succinate-semialdehyde dehydrogenase [Bacteroidia bacterium]|nr:NAD-dependent succinate-semialdehyde dehydrogenase [Bacteroidia bacterium]